MPSTCISVRRAWPAAQRAQLIAAVQAALIEGLRIPEQDRCVRLQAFAPEDFAVKPQSGEYFTLVEVDLFPGRSLDAKRRCYQAMVRNLGALGIPAAEVKVVLREVPQDNWGIRGGRPASEVDLGFKVEV
ncbi:MAG TPA: tautomerase family protein [Solimonas sp.]|nr:tautomerase family protein [Solimonas sp.]